VSKLVSEPVHNTIIRMAVPMLAGTFAMNTYQLTNAWFVSRLGTEALAAISFTFPVIMLFSFVMRGLCTGALTLVASALGGRDNRKAAALTSHALLLAIVFAIVLSVTGLLTIRPVFAALGAGGSVLAKTAAYMRIWYLGCVIMALQMVTSDIIIATGNTKIISGLMVGGTVVNVFFDIVLIFGKFGVPAMGIAGAACATLIAQGTTLCGALFILRGRLGLIDFGDMRGGGIFGSWFRILKFGVPGALGMILTPVASAVVTRLVAGYGVAAVAAAGVAGRIEMFAFMVPMTVGMSLIPFVAQNFGAGMMDRIKRARRGTMTFAATYGVFIAVMFVIFAGPMARLFSSEQAVIDVLKAYIYITCAGYGMLEVHRYAGFCMTGTHQPFQASALNIIRVVAFLIPLSLLGSWLFKLNGIFFGRLATDLLCGFLGIWWSGRCMRMVGRSLGRARSDGPESGLSTVVDPG
jgi:putative MATE family efflux protein